MTSDALNVNLTTDADLSDLLEDQPEDAEKSTTSSHEIDARRRLEEKLEEMRLQRDLKEFDFDF